MTDPSIFTVGGTVQARGGIYLPRPADDELFTHCQVGDFSYVLTARQMGKSSLMVRTSERLNAIGIQTVIIDLTSLGTYLDSEQWYLGLLENLVEQLKLKLDYKIWWNTYLHLGNTQRLSRFLREIVLEANDKPLVIFIDEIDTTLSLPFSDDFFAVIRACYNARGADVAYKRLAFVLLGVATPGDLIHDPHRTPFNIGTRIDLTDFTLEQALPLANGLKLSHDNALKTLEWVLAWTGGHPYLTQRLCQDLVEHSRSEWDEEAVAQIVDEIFFGEKSKQDGNLQFVSDMLTRRAPKDYVLDIMQNLLKIERGKRVKDEEQAIPKMHLKLTGIVRRDGNHLILRNKIYARVFDERWISENWPVSWKRRRMYATALLIILVIGFILSRIYQTQITQPRTLAQSQLVVLAQEPPVEPENARAAAAELTAIARNARQQNILIKFLWGNKLKQLVAYEDVEVPLNNYYHRRFKWLASDFTLSEPTRLRILALNEMAVMESGVYSQETLKLLSSFSPETRRSIWETPDILAQSHLVENIFKVLYPDAQHDKAPWALSFLAEGAQRINRPDLAEQALNSLREASNPTVVVKMATIQGGKFNMGGTAQEALAECQKYYNDCGGTSNWQGEIPVHSVSLSTFKIDIYEVTNAEYALCVDAEVCSAPASNSSLTREKYYDDNAFKDYPVINVSWFDASTYCSWRGSRLPTESEWEFAARGGLSDKKYPWGDVFEDGQANFCDVNCTESGANKTINDEYAETSPVGSYAPNGYGLYDMAGNVWEWVSDWYDAYPGDNNAGSNSDYGQKNRVLRGGSWHEGPYDLRVSYRGWYSPDGWYFFDGFRCAQ